MIQFLTIANWLLPLLYLALLIKYGQVFLLRQPSHSRLGLLLPVALFHAAFLVAVGMDHWRATQVSDFEVLSIVALALAGVYAIVEWASRDSRTGVFVFLAVFLFQYTSSVLHAAYGQPPAGTPTSGDWAHLHILPAIVAYTSFTLSAIYALLHLWAQRNLKVGKFGLLFDRLPPLELLGKMNWHALLLGFVFISMAIVTGGAMYGHGGGGLSRVMDVKVLSKIIAGSAAWLIFAVAIAGKIFGKWPAGRVAKVSVCGFVVVLALFVASMELS